MTFLALAAVGAAWLLLQGHLPGPVPALVLGAGAASLALGAGRPRWALALLVLAFLVFRAGHALESALLSRWPARAAGEDVILDGTLCDFPRTGDRYTRFLLVADGIEPRVPGARQFLVTWYGPEHPPAIGERWRLTVRLRSPRGILNPGGWDFEQWALARGIDATGYVRPWPAPERLGATPASGPGPCPAAVYRGRLARAITAAVGDRPALPYLLGLSVGAYQAIPPEEWESLRLTGTIHLISISGFHIALVAAPFLGAGVLAGRSLLRIGVPCVPRVVGACTALAAGAVYGALAGYSVPTLRSVLMLAVAALLVLARRPLAPGPVLALTVLLVLALDPLGLLLPGFWLSFGGVVLLVAAALLVRRRPGGPRTRVGCLRDRLHRVLALASGFLRLQLILAAGLAPLQLAFFGQVPLVGGLANLLAIPLFSGLLLPLVLAGAALVLPVPVLGEGLLRLAAATVDLWRTANGGFADLPGAVLAGSPPGAVPFLASTLGLLWLLVPRPWPWRWAGLVFLVPLGNPPPAPAAGELRVQVLDVGQGTAVLVQTRRHSLLYDAGPDHGGDGGSSLRPVLARAGAARLDALVVSHGDRDHAGGAPALLAAQPDAVLLSSGYGLPGRPGRPCRRGESWQWDGHHFRFLHPVHGTPDPGNDDSCVLEVAGPGGRLLLLGDVGEAVEEGLVAAGLVGPVDLVLAGHHGSGTSSGRALVAATRPRYVVFTTGFGNRWGFPVGAVQERWAAAGSCLLSTALGGRLLWVGDSAAGLVLLHQARTDDPRPWRAGAAGVRACPAGKPRPQLGPRPGV